jgi:hypothetical protein
MKKTRITLALAAATPAAACGSGDGGGESSKSINGWNGPAARDACHDKIKDRLKSPSTAEFEGLFDAGIEQGSTAWTITGHVDSQNGFGATVRSEYTCTVTPENEDRAMVSIDSLAQR